MAAIARIVLSGGAWLLVGALALAGCNRAEQLRGPCESKDVIAVAKEYYVAHVPPERLKMAGGRLSYFIEDEGNRWSVMVSPAREFKLNIQMVIRKSDMKVSRVPTQPPRQH